MSTPTQYKFAPAFHYDDVNISIDLETLSVEPNAHIIQIGAVAWQNFTPLGQFNEYIDPNCAQIHKRDVSPDTLAWWNVQDPELRKTVFSGTKDLADSLTSLLSWVNGLATTTDKTVKDINFWSKGPEFDMVILQSAYYQVHGYYPFNFRRHHSVRTAEASLNVTQKNYLVSSGINQTPHDALSDATWQGKIVNHFLHRVVPF